VKFIYFGACSPGPSPGTFYSQIPYYVEIDEFAILAGGRMSYMIIALRDQ